MGGSGGKGAVAAAAAAAAAVDVTGSGPVWESFVPASNRCANGLCMRAAADDAVAAALDCIHSFIHLYIWEQLLTMTGFFVFFETVIEAVQA